MQEEFSILPDDLQDTTLTLQRPKITIRDEYIFIVLVFPVEDKNNETITTAKVSLFIFPEMVLTLHNNDLPPLIEFRDQLEGVMSFDHGKNLFSPKVIVPQLLISLYDYCLPISNSLANDIDAIEEDIFHASLADTKLVKRLFVIERQVVDFRKIMRSHNLVIEKLLSVLPDFCKGRVHTAEIQELSEAPNMLWTNLESHTEAMDTLRETYESLTSFYLNDLLKILTILSLIIAPMAILGSIFGMNFKFIPLASHPFGFIYMILFMLFLTLLVFAYFKHKKWL